MHHFFLQVALQNVFPTPFCFLHKMLTFPLSLRDFLQSANKLVASLHPLPVFHPNHLANLFHMKG